MHLAIIFYNIGGYHAARLRAAYHRCQERGWHFTAIQVTNRTQEHPWGDLESEFTFPLKTLIPAENHSSDPGFESSKAATLLPALLQELAPSVLVIPGWGFPVSRTALRWCQGHRVPSIVMSESKEDDEKRTWWKEALKSWLYIRKYKAALVGGKRHRDYLIRLGFPEAKIFLGYDVVDNDYFSQGAAIARQNPQAARQRQPLIPLKPYFLAVTRLIPRKNILRLIEAFAAYCQQVQMAEAWNLVICGSGEEAERAHQLVRELKLQSHVHFPGFVNYQNIVHWYGLANGFIHPALVEQWGLVVNEACAAGLPILGSQTVGACSELVIEGHNGFLFQPDRPEEITRSLLRLHDLNPHQRKVMGEASQSIIVRYSPQQFAEGLFGAIEIALA
jgi:glycosyltransferase involved in cell wall biosynthesis